MTGQVHRLRPSTEIEYQPPQLRWDERPIHRLSDRHDHTIWRTGRRCERGRSSARSAGRQRNDPPPGGDGQGGRAGSHRTRGRQRLDRPGSLTLSRPQANANAKGDHSATRGGDHPPSKVASVLPGARRPRPADGSEPEHRLVSPRSRSRRWSRWRSRTAARASRQGLVSGSASGWIPQARAERRPARDQEPAAFPSRARTRAVARRSLRAQPPSAARVAGDAQRRRGGCAGSLRPRGSLGAQQLRADARSRAKARPAAPAARPATPLHRARSPPGPGEMPRS
jgi:hypothetical protein